MMSMILDHGVDLQAGPLGLVQVTCSDALIVRADTLALDRADGRLTAVVDGIAVDLGLLNTQLMQLFNRCAHAEVSAPHASGGTVTRRVPVVLH